MMSPQSSMPLIPLPKSVLRSAEYQCTVLLNALEGSDNQRAFGDSDAHQAEASQW